jgi:hypothetical protein
VVGAFTEPLVEGHVELGVNRFERAAAHLHEVLPELAVFFIARLELSELRPRSFGESFFIGGAFRSELVHALELCDRVGLEGGLIAPLTHPDDQEPKLGAPITEVIVAHHVVTHERQDPRNGVADDRRP